jgi:hypothetical protein
MRAEDDASANRHLAQLFNENRAGPPKLIDYVAVVDDFFAHVDGGAIKVKSDLDDIDGAHDSSAEAAWFQ